MMVKFVDLEHLKKATTLINYCKIDNYITHIIDNNVTKQNKYIPGTKIQIKNIDYLIEF